MELTGICKIGEILSGEVIFQLALKGKEGIKTKERGKSMSRQDDGKHAPGMFQVT